MIEGRSSAGLCDWLADRPDAWLDAISWAVLDLSGPWRLPFDTMLPDAAQVADPFHLVKLANQPTPRRDRHEGRPTGDLGVDSEGLVRSLT